MKLKTVYNEKDWLHPLVQVVGEEQLYCGYSHCIGACRYPALFLKWQGRELKAHSSMVAVGSVWQEKKWEGLRRYVPESENAEKLLEMMWW